MWKMCIGGRSDCWLQWDPGELSCAAVERGVFNMDVGYMLMV
jgi:hypothetical protein